MGSSTEASSMIPHGPNYNRAVQRGTANPSPLLSNRIPPYSCIYHPFMESWLASGWAFFLSSLSLRVGLSSHMRAIPRVLSRSDPQALQSRPEAETPQRSLRLLLSIVRGRFALCCSRSRSRPHHQGGVSVTLRRTLSCSKTFPPTTHRRKKKSTNGRQ